ncbi:hypothetical protein ARMGADRAFT_947600, partial [Armillaria gallica]
IIQILKNVMLYFSCSMPNLAMVIPAVDYIDKILATATLNTVQFSVPICAALAVVKDTLNVYYNCTDESKVYHIAMILHSHHKLMYFHNAGWPILWINKVQEMLTKKFETKYKD